MHEPLTTSLPRFASLSSWSNYVQILDFRRAKLPFAHILHRMSSHGDLSSDAVAEEHQHEYFRAPNLCPLQQRAFWFGAPLYFGDADLEGRKLKVNIKQSIFINHPEAMWYFQFPFCWVSWLERGKFQEKMGRAILGIVALRRNIVKFS